MTRTLSRMVAMVLCMASLAACSVLSPNTPPPAAPTGSQKSGPSSVAPTEQQVKSMAFLGTCGWDFPAPMVTMKDGKQVTKTAEWGSVSSTATITKVTPVSVGEAALMLVSFECLVGDTRLFGEHLVGLVDTVPQDLGIIAMNAALITVTADNGGLAVSYTYQSTSLAAPAEVSYRIELLGNTPIRLYEGQRLDQVDQRVAQLAPRQWSRGLVGVSPFSETDESYWLTGLLVDPEHVLTRDVLGGYASDCFRPTVYTANNEAIEYHSLNFTGSDRDHLFGSIVNLPKASTASVATYKVGVVPTKRTGLVVELGGRVPTLATADPISLADNQVWVATSAPEDEELVHLRTSIGDEDPGPSGFFLDWDATVLWQGKWWNQSRIRGVDMASGAMTSIPDPSKAIEEVCDQQ